MLYTNTFDTNFTNTITPYAHHISHRLHKCLRGVRVFVCTISVNYIWVANLVRLQTLINYPLLRPIFVLHWKKKSGKHWKTLNCWNDKKKTPAEHPTTVNNIDSVFFNNFQCFTITQRSVVSVFRIHILPLLHTITTHI